MTENKEEKPSVIQQLTECQELLATERDAFGKRETELMEENAELRALLQYGLTQMEKINGSIDRCVHYPSMESCPNHLWIQRVKEALSRLAEFKRKQNG